MLGTIARFLLALAALAPVALTWAIADYGRNGFNSQQLIALCIAFLVGGGCVWILRSAQRQLTKVTFSIVEIKVMDNEVVAYVIAYLFPLVAPAADVSLLSQAFVIALLALVLSTSHAFTFNPLLTLLGYHFYEAKCSSGVSYLLLSRNDITDVKTVQKVGRLSKHLMLDVT